MREDRYLINIGEPAQEYCNCGNLLNHKHTFSHDVFQYENDYVSYKVFKTFICPRCESVTILLYTAEESTDGYGESDQAKAEIDMNRSYSRKNLYSPTKNLHYSVPQSIAEVTYQAEAVIASSPRASFILCRAVLEEICNDFKIPTTNTSKNGSVYFLKLSKRVSSLVIQENLPKDLETVIDGIRELGNEGAHSDHLNFTNKLGRDAPERILLLIKYVIEKLYIDKYRQEEALKILSELKNKI